jgi:hypothetical protein
MSGALQITMMPLHCDMPRHNVPSPLAGEGQGRGCSQTHELLTTPLPTPPPQGGREQAESAARTAFNNERA